MSVVEKVGKISARLDAIVIQKNLSSPETLELVKSLEKLPIDLDVLQKTSIGRTVNTLRKETTNDNVAVICKSLVKSWKSLLKDGPGGEKADGSPNSTGEPASKRPKMEITLNHSQSVEDLKKSNGSLHRSCSSPGVAQAPTPPSGKSSTPQPSVKAASVKVSNRSDGSADTFTNDAVRLKTRELIVKGLTKEESPEGALDPIKIAAEIETCIYKEFRSTDTRYKNRIRSRVINLQDAKNPRLRENVLLGHIEPARFAVMTSDEMASEEMKNLRDKYTKEAINDHQMSTTSGTETDLLQCGKCKQRKCTYNQVQTRSADEPMTTFVYCNHCGNRWKFC